MIYEEDIRSTRIAKDAIDRVLDYANLETMRCAFSGSQNRRKTVKS